MNRYFQVSGNLALYAMLKHTAATIEAITGEINLGLSISAVLHSACVRFAHNITTVG